MCLLSALCSGPILDTLTVTENHACLVAEEITLVSLKPLSRFRNFHMYLYTYIYIFIFIYIFMYMYVYVHISLYTGCFVQLAVLKQLFGGIFQILACSLVFCQIMARILKTLLLGVSSYWLFLNNLCETNVPVIFWLPSVFLMFRAVTVCIMFSLSSAGYSQFCFSTDHHEDLQRISCRMGVCCFLWYE